MLYLHVLLSMSLRKSIYLSKPIFRFVYVSGASNKVNTHVFSGTLGEETFKGWKQNILSLSIYKSIIYWCVHLIFHDVSMVNTCIK